MPKIKCTRLIFLAVALSANALLAQNEKLRGQKVELDSLVQRLFEVQARQKVMSRQADSLARVISKLKQRPLSPFETRTLETALARSQIMADSLQALQRREQGLDRMLRQKAELLLKNLHDELVRLVESGKEAKKSGNRTLQEHVAREIRTCRQWQAFCQQILAEPPPAIVIYEVRAEPGDDEITLKRKADFLRDQADRLERDARRLEQKLSEIRAEEEMRQRMNEFAADIALLEPLNEGLRSTSGINREGTGPVGVDHPGRAGELLLQSLSPGTVAAFSLPANIAELSSQDLQRWQERLHRLLQQRRWQADSLKKRADEVEKLGRVRAR
ncbi:MAG: hypothetical protein ONB48_12760 [candidate division KSB1 bacterium]|nr:hypothetical protein [candidate division KSB1 bacterium]MDZ7275034.1 hypothetical protein [candidate division KSB1 bacterium]MDZ7286517.1 hypothetical protein [candidate division KSB1 bacterium]MDZ7299319.1 hypothetical protein [candidate division KSB1 bacterium]MDZ7306990.1 hypothetical protein [candidate division KSB1 bacterium]